MTYIPGGSIGGMAGASTTSDKSVGFAVLFGVLGLAGALAMYLGATVGTQLTAALGFGGAMLAASILIAAIHVYG
jgi:Na+/phosphate symporter